MAGDDRADHAGSDQPRGPGASGPGSPGYEGQVTVGEEGASAEPEGYPSDVEAGWDAKEPDEGEAPTG